MLQTELRCIVLATSGRALAESARAAGIGVHVFDLFADDDTRAVALSVERVGSLTTGFSADSLLPALARLAQRESGLPVIWGSGFEDRVPVLEAVARAHTVLGCSPDLLRRLADPATLVDACRATGLATPEVRRDRVPAEGRWLCKQQGASGGRHVRWLGAGAVVPPGCYAQRYVDGTPLSLLGVGDGRSCQLAGLTQHWSPESSPPESAPFRRAGLCTLAPDAALQARARAVAQALVPAFGLRGLFGIDVIDDGARLCVIDVNPRPPASFELHERGQGLLQRHVLGCLGQLPPLPLAAHRAARAQAVVYAPRAFRVPTLRWPTWVSDRPAAGTLIEWDDPVCTVHGAGRDADAARRRTTGRRVEIGHALGFDRSDERAPRALDSSTEGSQP